MVVRESGFQVSYSGYVEPDLSSFKERQELTQELTDEELIKYRLRMIIGSVAVFEPMQTGVLRYPPVQVEVPRKPDFISRYIDMPPTVWSEVNISPETQENT